MKIAQFSFTHEKVNKTDSLPPYGCKGPKNEITMMNQITHFFSQIKTMQLSRPTLAIEVPCENT